MAESQNARREAPMPPLEGEVPNEREAEGFVRIFHHVKSSYNTQKTSWKIPGGRVGIIEILPCISEQTVPFF